MSEDISSSLPKNNELVTIHEENNEFFSLCIEADHAGFELYASIAPHESGTHVLTPELFAGILKNCNIPDFSHSAMKEFCDKTAAGEKIIRMKMASGILPVNGYDERIEFKVLITTDKPRYEKDEHGNIDYSRPRLFDNVYPETLIAVMHDPEYGKPGKDIHGNVIQSTKGKWLEKRPKAGDGVRFEANGTDRRFIATALGRVVFEDNTVSVVDHFMVKGNVDYNVGHIDFAGSVSIGGDVQSLFNVKCIGPLLIKGNVSQSRIECEKDIDIGGVSGGEKGEIICGGNLNARYLNDAIIRCKGDVHVKNGIVNCDIKCAGKVIVEMGSIVGGVTVAKKGVEAKTVGSDTAVKTRVILGVCYITEEKLKALSLELEPIQRELEFYSKKLEPFVKNPKLMLTVSAQERDQIREMAAKVKEINVRQEAVRQQIKEFETKADEDANPILSARTSIARGLIVTVGQNSEEILPQRKPVSIIRNSKTGMMRILPLHNISDNVKTIEREIVQMEYLSKTKNKPDTYV